MQSNLPPLADLMEDPGQNTTSDAQMLAAYLRSGKSKSPLPMSIGDPYLLGGRLPAGLAAHERRAPRYLGGYSRTPAGIPEARRLIARETIRSMQLEEHASWGEDFDLHLTSGTGTRGIMSDFGKYLLDLQPSGDRRTPVVLCASPTWDYAGVFEPLGYEMKFWPLHAEQGWAPNAQDVQKAVAEVEADPAKRLAIVVVNTQHNPTGCSWPRDVLTQLFETATSRGAAILLDDPYRFVVTDDAAPVAAPQILFEHLTARHVPAAAWRLWCRVESYGKAFSCNDWGIGSVMAHPAVLNELAGYTFRWAFPRAGLRQWGMAQWLADPACHEYLAKQRVALGRKRRHWAAALQDMGWPKELTVTGTTTPYFLMALPPHYQSKPDGINAWRQEILDSSGVLLSFASIEQEDTVADAPFLRAYLGGSEAVVREAARRLKAAGVRYQ